MNVLSHPMGTPPPGTHLHSLIVRLGYIEVGVDGASCSSLTSGDPTHPLDHNCCVTALKVRPSDAKWGKASDMRMCMTGMSILRRMLFRSLHSVHALTCSLSPGLQHDTISQISSFGDAAFGELLWRCLECGIDSKSVHVRAQRAGSRGPLHSRTTPLGAL